MIRNQPMKFLRHFSLIKYAFCLFISVNISCSTIRETHYFKDKVESKDDQSVESTISNYYKVHIRGWAFLSSSRYVSGYFDEDVVNEYFNEIRQPKGGALFPWVPIQVKSNSTTQTSDSPDSQTVSQTDTQNATSIDQAEVSQSSSASPIPEETCKECDSKSRTEPGTELVIILSTNAEAIATEIKNVATNNDVLQSLVLLNNQDKIKEAQMLLDDIEEINTQIELYILKVESYLSSLRDSTYSPDQERNVIQFLQSELKEMGVTKSFSGINDLKSWYNENY